MKTPLYFAPLNKFGNYLYRHLLLKHGANFVFTEMIRIDRLEKEMAESKLKIFDGDEAKTIFQIAAGSENEITIGVSAIKKVCPKVKEINLNMGCPQSTMVKSGICGGILLDLELMRSLATSLVMECKKYKITPGAKIRLGPSLGKIIVEEYLQILQAAGITKIYIHARSLGETYHKKCNLDALQNLKIKFSNLEIILNGDVDSFKKFETLNKIPNDGIMIGRSALSNPLVFKDILRQTNSTKYHDGFDPILNNPHLHIADKTQIDMDLFMFIDELINLAGKYETNEFILNNIKFMLKGISDANSIITLYRENEIERARDLLKSKIFT